MLILLLCGLPTFVCGLFLSQIVESPRYIYGSSKVKALNILNMIAEKNHLERVIIDLSKSEWVENYKPSYNISYKEGFYFNKIKTRMIIGIILMYAVQLSMNGSQILLDRYLSAYWRGGVISLTTSLSFIVLSFFIGKMRRNITRNLIAISVVSVIMAVLLITLNESAMEIPVIISSVLLRTVSSMGFGVILIWAIETFPTVFRLMGSSFVMIGGSLAGVLPYMFRERLDVQVWLMLGVSVVSIPFSYRMPDTLFEDLKDDLLLGHFWDRDRFYKF
jgi:hypothetical protein